jgi:glyoxylase-like metal-dependent hydrolase (beta-lactamase superfamily II)
VGVTIDLLDLGHTEVPKSVLARGGTAETVTSYVQSFLIRGAGETPVVVDTGYRDNPTMEAAGFSMPPLREDQTLEGQLSRFGLEPADIGMVLMTHLQIDHAGQIDKFPMTTPVVLMRREVEVAIAGSRGQAFGGLGEVYPAIDMRHIFERIYTPGALAMLDLDITGPLEIAPGVACEAARGHTEGSMLIRVDTDEGVATICGDVVYNVAAALVDRPGKYDAWESGVSQNFTLSEREETAAIRRACVGTRLLLPGHDRPALLELGKVVGRIAGTTVPGPVTETPAVSGMHHRDEP